MHNKWYTSVEHRLVSMYDDGCLSSVFLLLFASFWIRCCSRRDFLLFTFLLGLCGHAIKKRNNNGEWIKTVFYRRVKTRTKRMIFACNRDSSTVKGTLHDRINSDRPDKSSLASVVTGSLFTEHIAVLYGRVYFFILPYWLQLISFRKKQKTRIDFRCGGFLYFLSGSIIFYCDFLRWFLS